MSGCKVSQKNKGVTPATLGNATRMIVKVEVKASVQCGVLASCDSVV